MGERESVKDEIRGWGGHQSTCDLVDSGQVLEREFHGDYKQDSNMISLSESLLEQDETSKSNLGSDGYFQ